MNELLSKLTGDQALEVLERLASGDARLAHKIETEAKRVLETVDVDDVAELVFFELDAIDVQDCWDRAGSDRDGYTSPDEAAQELIEEELQPHLDQAQRYHDLGMLEQERDTCAGVVLGLYRYEKESKSEFRNWSEDLPLNAAESLLSEWQERNPDPDAHKIVDAFIRKRCPDWAKMLMG